MKLSKEQKDLLKYEMQLEICRRDFYDFCVFMDKGFFTVGKPHLKLIAEAFQEVSDGKVLKLAVSMPPRAGKSYITSLYCAWVLGKYPLGSVMRNSYAAKLAEKFSKDIRDGIIPSLKYKEVFPGVKAAGSIDSWSLDTNAQPSYFCAGVGGAILGFGCNKIAILDDPIKNIEEALSETVIESTWNWYTSTHLSRLETNCAEIQIATRWSRKDPIGRITDENGEQYNPNFKVINIAALTDEGKSFCEEIKTTAEYMELKKVTDEFIWEDGYMQHPVESKGLLFPIEDLHRFKMCELKGKQDGIIGFTDTADKGIDFLCSPIGRQYNEKVFITDVVFTQDGVEISEPLVAQQIIDTHCDMMIIESNNGGYGFTRNVKALILGKSPCTVSAENTSQNKETRIIMSAGYIKDHFYFRTDYEVGSMYDKFMRQLTSYIKLGKNKHDDGADALTGLAERVKNRTYAKPLSEYEQYREDKHTQMIDDMCGDIPSDFF